MKRVCMRTGICIIWLALMAQRALALETLVPVGQVIGIELTNGTVTVAGLDDRLEAAKQAGIQAGDVLLQIDDTPVREAGDVRHALERADGAVTLTVLRRGKEQSLEVTPSVTRQGPKLGVYLKQGVTGVGTVTWYDPDSGSFGALGHGVNDPRGALVEMDRGQVYRATVVSVKKGAAGEPGQLIGALAGAAPVGSLEKNTSRGIFGSTRTGWAGDALDLCPWEEIRTGPAVIRATVAGDRVEEYAVEILKLYPHAGDAGRNMLLKVTDPALLEATGGIVQGMGVSYNKDNQWNP